MDWNQDLVNQNQIDSGNDWRYPALMPTQYLLYFCSFLQNAPEQFTSEEFPVTESKVSMDVSFPGAAFVIISCKESQLGCRKEWVPPMCSNFSNSWWTQISSHSFSVKLFKFSPVLSAPLAPAFTRPPGLESWCTAWVTKCVEMASWIWWRPCAIRWTPHLPTQALLPLPPPTNTPLLSSPLIRCTSNWVSIQLLNPRDCLPFNHALVVLLGQNWGSKLFLTF